MTTKEIISEQFAACYTENGWFVALRNAIDGVTAEEAAWKPDGVDNSIWEILTHLSYDNGAYVQRFEGIDFQHTVTTNEETFSAPATVSTDAWQTEIENFDRIMVKLRSLIEDADESKFDEPVIGKEQFTWARAISDLNAHNAYHGGQILLLRKLQGSWYPEKGVN